MRARRWVLILGAVAILIARDGRTGVAGHLKCYKVRDTLLTVHVAMLNSARFAGYADWRMPNVRELLSIANYEHVNPAVSSAFNTACAPGCTVLTCSCARSSFSSSSTHAAGPTRAWWVNFHVGLSENPLHKGSPLSARAVRGSVCSESGRTTPGQVPQGCTTVARLHGRSALFPPCFRGSGALSPCPGGITSAYVHRRRPNVA